VLLYIVELPAHAMARGVGGGWPCFCVPSGCLSKVTSKTNLLDRIADSVYNITLNNN